MRGRKIDLYLCTELLSPFLGGVLFFTFLYLMSRVLLLADFFILHGAPLAQLLRMAGLFAIAIQPTALPISFLIAVLIAFGRLSSENELIALKASGVSMPRLAVPVAGCGAAVVALCLALSLSWAPWSEREVQATYLRIANSKALAKVTPGMFVSGFFGLLLYAESVEKQSNRMHKVFIYDEREPTNPVVIVAREGELVPVKTGRENAHAITLKLYGGSVHKNDPADEHYEKFDFRTYQLFLEDPGENHTSGVRQEQLSQSDLLERVRGPGRSPAEANEAKGELSRRYALALAPLIFVFLGIGLGSVRTRNVKAGAGLFTFGLLFVYWTLQSVCIVALQNGWFGPLLAMQVPNLILLGLGIWAFRRAMAW